jgi:SAM-dependent methyltransferase
MRQVFSHIYLHNRWNSTDSVSGQGSTLANTAAIRRQLPEVFSEYSIKTLLDIPCGDFVWMKEIAGSVEHYIGADIVEPLIRANSERYGGPEFSHVRFANLSLGDDPLPKSDLIFCRDCLVHFSFHDIDKALRNVRRSGARYFITTTFPCHLENSDITTGKWRPINLQAAPFNLPEPLRLISEEYTGSRGNYHDKSLGLWKAADI